MQKNCSHQYTDYIFQEKIPDFQHLWRTSDEIVDELFMEAFEMFVKVRARLLPDFEFVNVSFEMCVCKSERQTFAGV